MESIIEKQSIPFDIQENTVLFNNDIQKVLNDLLSKEGANVL